MEDALKQAKLKALSLLNYMDRTEEGLRQKLKEKSYSEEVIEQTLDYVKSFGYINDISYAERYILNKQNSKSRQEIYMSLSQKGVCREDIESAMENCYETESEIDVIRRLCEKKHFSAEGSSDAEKQKMYAYLVRKGFRSEEVRKILTNNAAM